MSQIFIAAKIGISQGHLSRVLAGQDVGRATYKKIAAALGNGRQWFDIPALAAAELESLLTSELAEND